MMDGDASAASANGLVSARPSSIIDDWHWPRGWRLAASLSALAGCLFGAVALVYVAGGTQFSPVHFVYVSILGAALLFSAAGGIVTGIVAGLLVGPLMPLDTASASPQETLNWLIRMGFFALIGGVAGTISGALVRHVRAMHWYGFTDPPTKLPNRNGLLHTLNGLLADESPRTRSIVLVKVGLVDLGAIVAALDHRSVDLLVEAVGQRIRKTAGKEKPVFALEDGRFGLLLVDRSIKDAVRAAQRIVQALHEPVVIDDMPVFVEACAAIARYPHDASDAVSLLRAASAALEDAMTERQPYTMYNRKRDETRRRMGALLPELQADLRSGSSGLALHYQPKVSLADGRCLGVEALLRWTHTVHGPVPPGDFIPLAERTTLIHPLTNWVLMAACRQLVDWREQRFPMSAAMNVSVRNLEDESFVDGMLARMNSLGVDPGFLEIEVTETALVEAMGQVHGSLERLRAEGMRVALDDFGTGQSSLAYMRDLPIDTIKFDRAFVHDITWDRKKQVIVGKAIEIAHDLGFDVVAEGIEDEETAAHLREMGCTTGQGYLYARPQPAAELAEWLRTRSAHPAACPE